MNVTVLGWYNHGNCGDEAYKLAFPLLLPTHNFTFISDASKFDFSNTDFIVVGGGDIVKQNVIAPLYNIDIPKIAASVTITNDSDLENLKIFRKIIVRDNVSLELAQKYHDNVGYLPDFSFMLQGNKPDGQSLIANKFASAGHTLSPKVVTVILNSYITYNHDAAMYRDVIAFHKVIHELARISESMSTSWIFLPFSVKSPWDDRSAASWLAERCKNKYYKNLTIYDKLSVQETLNVITASNAVISSRLHSTIFSVVAGVPFVDILHHNKNYGFIKTIGKENWGTWLWQFEANKVDSLLRDFLIIGGQASELQRITNMAKEQLRNASQFILR